MSTTYIVTPPGSTDSSYHTIQAAANLAVSGDTVAIKGTTSLGQQYTYRETVTPKANGVTFTNYGNTTVTVSGADPVTSGYTLVSGTDIYQTSNVSNTGKGSTQVFIDGTSVNEARWPVVNPSAGVWSQQATVGSYSGTRLYDSNLPNRAWTGATIHITPGTPGNWVSYTGTVTNAGAGWLDISLPSGAPTPVSGDHYYLTDSYQALDSTAKLGQWYIDAGNTLSLVTPVGDSPGSHDVEVQDRLYAFDLRGFSGTTIRNISVFAAGIQSDSSSSNTVIDTVNTFYAGVRGLITNGWTVDGANPGSAAISIAGNYSTVENCTVAFSAGSGISISNTDHATVTGNTVHDVDYSGTDDAGILIPSNFAPYATVTYNKVYNVGRSAINVRGYQALISHNTIYEFGLMTSDCGGIYTVPSNVGTAPSGGEFSYNTIYQGHAASGYDAVGVYLDNSSSGFAVHDNVVTDVDAGYKTNYDSTSNHIDHNLFGGTKAAMERGNVGSNFTGTTVSNNVFGNGYADFGGTDSGSNLRVPTGLAVSSKTATSVSLTWTAAANAASYVVSRTDPQGHVTTMSASGTPFTDSAVSPGTTYTYAVAAVHATDNWQTGWSSSVAVTTPAGSPTASVTFLNTDSATQGTWTGVYGSDGYYVVGNGLVSHYPSYVQITASGQNDYQWATSNSDVKELQTAPGASTRVAGQEYAFGSFTYDVNITDGQTHQLSLYLLDYDNKGRAETVQVADAGSGTQLDSRTATGFQNGVYYVWNISGHVKFTITRTAGDNATVSGLFFGKGVSHPSSTYQLGIWDPSTQTFYFDSDGNGIFNDVHDTKVTYSNASTWTPVTGDWAGTGNGKYTGLYDPSTSKWYLDSNENGVPQEAGDAVYQFGNANTDRPIVGDWQGDGRTRIGVWRAADSSFTLDLNGDGTWESASDKWFQITLPFSSSDTYYPIAGDWNGLGAAQIGFYDATTNTWYLDRNAATTSTHVFDTASFGSAGDKPVVGPWNSGSSTQLLGTWRPSDLTFRLDANGNKTYDSGDSSYTNWGLSSSDIPVIGGGGVTTAAPTYQLGFWDAVSQSFYIDANHDGVYNSANDLKVTYNEGTSVVPLSGDWAGAGHGKYTGVYDPSTSRWYLDSNENNIPNEAADAVYQFGNAGTDKPIVGDWTGDGKTKIGVWRASDGSFTLDMNGNGIWDSGTDKWFQVTLPFSSSDTYYPVAGDWNGDGKAQIGFFDSTTHTWYLDQNEVTASSHAFSTRQFGNAGDVPVVGRWSSAYAYPQVGTWRPSDMTFRLDSNNDGTYDTGDVSFANWGLSSSDLPLIF